ncbi:MAG TPA: hypothetical protein VFM55_10905 [Micromonosporaceae bacterium]|nr:hypothetical protein [Micromonosporaceae bacterium]
MADSWWSDEQLVPALREALRAAAVPERLIEVGRAAYDSYGGCDPVTEGERPRLSSVRTLTLVGEALTVELELIGDTLLGQLVPPQLGEVEVGTRDGSAVVVADDVGCFAIRPIPAGPFRLRCRSGAGGEVRSGWLEP